MGIETGGGKKPHSTFRQVELKCYLLRSLGDCECPTLVLHVIIIDTFGIELISLCFQSAQILGLFRHNQLKKQRVITLLFSSTICHKYLLKNKTCLTQSLEICLIAKIYSYMQKNCTVAFRVREVVKLNIFKIPIWCLPIF